MGKSKKNNRQKWAAREIELLSEELRVQVALVKSKDDEIRQLNERILARETVIEIELGVIKAAVEKMDNYL